MKRAFLLILVTIAVCACHKPNSAVTNEAIIMDSEELIHQEKTPMSSIMEVTDIIPLETSDSCLLGEIEKIIKRDGIIYVKSQNRPLTLFDGQGRFLHNIGKIGAGPKEYSTLIDFDIKDGQIYILSNNRIQVYGQGGEWIRTISIDLNASGMRLANDKILLSALGDNHVVHLLDEQGQQIDSLLEKNQALRLSRSISFIKYGDKFLFPMGRSNDLLAYDTSNETFKQMFYLASEQLSNEQVAALMEETPNYRQELNDRGCFDGLLTDNTHAIVPFIKKGNITLWIKNLKSSQTKAYELTALENDLTFSPAHTFFWDNTEDDIAFLTYAMPHQLKESLEVAENKEKSPCFEKLTKATEMSGEEGNPILIEYKIKGL